MQREFGKRTAARLPREQPVISSTPARAKSPTVDSSHMPKAIAAIVLTITVVGGMFLLPKLGQCDGRQGALGLDWCRLMKASVEGAVRGVAISRGSIAAGGH
jgi:hypothetical protein